MDMKFEVSRYTKDKHPASHMHEQYEIFLSLSNEGKFFVREEGYPLHFGLIFILSPFEIHRCFCEGVRDYDRYVLRFSKEYLEQMSTENADLVTLFGSAPIVQQLESTVLAKVLDQLSVLSTPVGAEFGDDVERNLKLLDFLLLIARIVNNAKVFDTAAIKGGERASEILQYIHSNYNQDISLEQLSKKFFISKSRLSQIFKNTTGFSVNDYIITYRIKIACTLLQNGMSVQEAGNTVGFRTNTHFIRTFKKKVGNPPGNFSKDIRQTGSFDRKEM